LRLARLLVLVQVLLAAWPAVAPAQPSLPERADRSDRPAERPPERPALDLREEITRIEVSVRDLYGRRETRPVTLTQYRPPGDGPFPIAIVNHGRATADRRAGQPRQRFEQLARYLVAKGFAVLVPTRVGYGDSYGDFDPEESGPCNAKRFEPMATAASDQVLAALDHALRQPWADTSRWITLGASVGGMAALATASRAPAGLRAAINFSGGAGGDPQRRRADPCGAVNLERLWRTQAASARIDTLWIYWTHDWYWGEKLPRRWAQAWNEGGGRAEFHQLDPWSTDEVDGHTGVGNDMDRWVPLVEAFLARAGFTQSGVITRPPASGFARVDEVERVPVPAERRERLYPRFLEARPPRAFAVGTGGAAGWASGDWALGRALGACQASGQACRLYAVDDEVVWTP